MATPAEHIVELVEELREALAEERRALLSGAPEAINAAAQHKAQIAEAIDEASLVPGTLPPASDTLLPLVRYNQENGIICAAMLRHLTAALDRLRQHDPHRSYRPDGSEQNRSAQHALGAA